MADHALGEFPRGKPVDFKINLWSVTITKCMIIANAVIRESDCQSLYSAVIVIPASSFKPPALATVSLNVSTLQSSYLVTLH